VLPKKTTDLVATGFAAITISFMVFSFLCNDQFLDSTTNRDSPAQVLGRVFFWIGSVSHCVLTIKCVGDWFGRRLDLEHIHTHWLIYPTGLAIAAFCAPVIGPFAEDKPISIANVSIARFFMSFAWLLWITLFVITFFKVLTGHNSDKSLRHGIWLWIATVSVLGFAELMICLANGEDATLCRDDFELYYYSAMFLFLIFVWASFPRVGFFGRIRFSMAFWIDCFALDTLAICASLSYLTNGWHVSGILEFFFLALAALANLVALLHTLTNLLRKHVVATPEVRLGPLDFVSLMHNALRANFPKIQYHLHAIDLESDSNEARSNLGLFAAHFNRFRIIQDEHLTVEESVVYKVCSDYFPGHGKKFTMDHRDDRVLLVEWCELADIVLDARAMMRDRKEALDRLRGELPAFFSHLLRHFRGEEENLDPIVRKYLPLKLKKNMARDVWRITPAEKWEIIIPFVLVNLPMHEQRVRFLRSLLWSIPERSQQVGAIVYRNVDAVMWERLRVEVREMIPRGAPQWIRYT